MTHTLPVCNNAGPMYSKTRPRTAAHLQEQLLRTLTAANGNWVRVGDPNQAINTTFTSADTSYLSEFIERHNELSRDLPVSGRSAEPIIDSGKPSHRMVARRRASANKKAISLRLPLIQPAPPGDPQPNPPAGESEVYLYAPTDRPLTSVAEVDVIVRSLIRWLPDNRHRTVAVLSPTQARTYHIADALEDAGLPVDDSLMRTGSATRQAAKALACLLAYLAQPETGKALSDSMDRGLVAAERRASCEAAAHERADRNAGAANGRVRPGRTGRGAYLCGRAQQLRKPEDFLFPAQSDWLEILTWMDDVEGFRDVVEGFRAICNAGSQATILPIDELMLTIGNELFDEPAHLALTHHLAVLLAKLRRENEAWRLPELARELEHISQNRRRMPDFCADVEGFEPKPGVVTVATMHGAKGLEWDRVYLTAVNTYGFPSGSEDDQYRGEAFYVRDRLNLVAETLEQLDHLDMGTLDEYCEGRATPRARLETGGRTSAPLLRRHHPRPARAHRHLQHRPQPGHKSTLPRRRFPSPHRLRLRRDVQHGAARNAEYLCAGTEARQHQLPTTMCFPARTLPLAPACQASTPSPSPRLNVQSNQNPSPGMNGRSDTPSAPDSPPGLISMASANRAGFPDPPGVCCGA